MEETLEGGRGPPRAVVPLKREREREARRFAFYQKTSFIYETGRSL